MEIVQVVACHQGKAFSSAYARAYALAISSPADRLANHLREVLKVARRQAQRSLETAWAAESDGDDHMRHQSDSGLVASLASALKTFERIRARVCARDIEPEAKKDPGACLPLSDDGA